MTRGRRRAGEGASVDACRWRQRRVLRPTWVLGSKHGKVDRVREEEDRGGEDRRSCRSKARGRRRVGDGARVQVRRAAPRKFGCFGETENRTEKPKTELVGFQFSTTPIDSPFSEGFGLHRIPRPTWIARHV